MSTNRRLLVAGSDQIRGSGPEGADSSAVMARGEAGLLTLSGLAFSFTKMTGCLVFFCFLDKRELIQEATSGAADFGEEVVPKRDLSSESLDASKELKISRSMRG